MEESLYQIDLSKYNLEADVEKLFERFINHIETLNKDLEELIPIPINDLFYSKKLATNEIVSVD